MHSEIQNLETSLVVQWLRIPLPMQGTWVWFLAQEESTCCGQFGPGATGACSRTLEQQLLRPSTTTTEVCALQQEVTTENSPCSLQLEKACSQQWRPCAAKKKRKKRKRKKEIPNLFQAIGGLEWIFWFWKNHREVSQNWEMWTDLITLLHSECLGH